MSLPRPIESYHFQANLIWWDSPFKLGFIQFVIEAPEIIQTRERFYFWLILSADLGID
jgi:hypothetical protein